MARTMQAAVVEAFGKPLAMREWDIPTPGPGQILVKTEACGVCHTDLHAAHGDWPLKPALPFIPGHEAIGRVVAVGPGVTIVKEGDRVGVPWLYSACGHCEHCLSAWETVCGEARFGGYTRNGGFAEYVRVMDWIVEHGTVKIPDGVSFEQACFVEPVNTCLKGIEALRLERGETVLAIGQGPIGITLSVLARRAGATVITSDLYPERLKISKSLGFERTIDASQQDAVRSVREQTEGRGADAVILAVGSNALIRPAMEAARPGGRILLFAQTQRGEVVVDPAAICVDEKALLGSYSASVDLQRESVRFVMNREMDLEKLISHRFPLQDAARALELAAHPQPASMKIVIQPGSTWKREAWEGSQQ